jgi:putative nucleotidyltransferase with HDIG domain
MKQLQALSKFSNKLVRRRRKRKTESTSSFVKFVETSKAVSLGLFVLTVVSIVFISFVGVSPAGFQILENQRASVRIIADQEFSYVSKLLTERKQTETLNQVPPVYRIDMTAYEQFERHLKVLFTDLEDFNETSSKQSPGEQSSSIDTIAEKFNLAGPYRLGSNDLATLLQYGDNQSREKLAETGLFILKEIYRSGVYNTDSSVGAVMPDTVSLINIKKESGAVGQSRVQSFEDAQTFLRINLAAENIPPAVVTSVFRLLRNGLTANLFFDQEESNALKDKMLQTLQPEVVKVEAGRSIIEPGTRVSPEQSEMLKAYQEYLNNNKGMATRDDLEMYGRILLVIAMIIAAVFYIRMEDLITFQSNGRLALLALVLVFNLSLVRITFELSSLPFFLSDPSSSAILPYLAPVILAPIIITILIGTSPALFASLLISLFTGVIYGNRLDILVVSFLASTIAVYGCRNVRSRNKIVRSGGFAGLTVALFAFLLGNADKLPLLTIGKQMLAGQMTGLITGMVIVGLLPILESLFRQTTDITFIELTDYNHPLLRKMQMEAPGTYHHSLMVANLSENAANIIGANPLACRVCSMFHDIGKLVKPEYFAENQREGVNPHDEKNPSFSALIIKSHVKEGVHLALKHKLPRPIINVIRQHHGTSLIWFFFHRAREANKSANTPDLLDPEQVSETTYRYDGPRPRFKESSIIFLADSIEAASRSLQKVTPQNVDELISNIFEDRIKDGQLDESPLTVAEISKIKESFVFTLLNSLHSRIAYPKKEKESTSSTENGGAKSEVPNEESSLRP